MVAPSRRHGASRRICRRYPTYICMWCLLLYQETVGATRRGGIVLGARTEIVRAACTSVTMVHPCARAISLCLVRILVDIFDIAEG